MKLCARKEALLPSLTRVSGATDRKSAGPNAPAGLIGLQIVDGRLAVDASDGELAWSVNVADVDGDPSFSVAVDGRLLLDVLRQAPNASDIDLSLHDGKLEVRYGRSRFTLAAFGYDDRLVWTEAIDDDARTLDFDATDLRRWIDATSFAMAVKDVRYFLEGLLWSVKADGLHCVATDGHRLARVHAPLDDAASSDPGQPVQAILPRRAVTELRRNLVGFEGRIRVRLGRRTASIALNDDRLDLRLIEGQFPDYERVIPPVTDRPITTNAQALTRAIQRVSLVANERTHSVRLTIEPGEIVVRSFSERNEAEEHVEAEHDHERLEIGFNPQYLTDVLGLVGDEPVVFSVRDASSSVRIDVPSLPGAEFVVMPIRL